LALPTEYQLKVRLLHIEPPVWRRFLVRASVNLAKLHEILQDIMGWDNKHLYSFLVDDRVYEDPHPEAAGANARRTRLSTLRLAPGDRFQYVYDYGDDWYHELTVEDAVGGLRANQWAQCLDGENACPPEDSGGPPGYARVLEALERPDDLAFRELHEWIPPGFRPDVFDLRATNRILSVAHRYHRAV